MNTEKWNNHFHTSSPIFDPIKPFIEDLLNLKTWPLLNEINQLFIKDNMPIRAVEQTAKPEKFDDHYESRIFLKNELQTRIENWHDFFNAMVWLGFRQTKQTLNKLHYLASQHRKTGTNRSPIENAVALFDECGLIIISNRQDLLDLIKTHQWKKIFVDHKSEFNKNIKCITFGHAMYEKALNPYIGMTAHALLIHSNELLNTSLLDVDKFVAKMWQNKKITTTRDLQPVPVLGIPGWYKGNKNDGFYANTDYFRPKKSK